MYMYESNGTKGVHQFLHPVYVSFYGVHVFASWSACSARTAGTKIALRLLVRPHLSYAQYITSYVTMQLRYRAAFAGLQAKLQQMKVVVYCLDGKNLVSSRSWHVATNWKRITKVPSQHFRCTAFDCFSVSARCLL